MIDLYKLEFWNLKAVLNSFENYDEAIQYHKHRMKNDFEYIIKIWDEINNLTSNEEFIDAIRWSDYLLELETNKIDVLNVRGNLKSIVGDHQGALQDFLKAYDIDPNDEIYNPKFADCYKSIGKELYKQERYKEAIEYLSKSISLNPLDKWTYSYRAESYDKIDNLDESIKDLSTIIAMEPNESSNYVFRGQVKSRLNDIIGCVEDFNKAKALGVTDKYLLELMHSAYYQIAFKKQTDLDYLGAIEFYNLSIEINPLFDDVILNRGVAKESIMDYAGALEDYLKVLEVNPENVLAKKYIQDLNFGDFSS